MKKILAGFIFASALLIADVYYDIRNTDDTVVKYDEVSCDCSNDIVSYDNNNTKGER